MPNIQGKLEGRAGLHSRLYASSGHDNALASLPARAATSGVSGTRMTLALLLCCRAGPKA
jgi:hypothetical protein